MTPPFVDPSAAAPSEPTFPKSHAERAAINFPYFLAEAQKMAREHPELFVALGITPEQYAREMTAPGLSVAESVEAGWISPSEGRLLQGRATPEDLRDLGHSPEDARTILADQQGRACVSST